MTRKAALLPRFGLDTPPAPLHRAGDSFNMVNRGLGSRLGVTRKPVPVFLAPSQDDGKVESILRIQKNARAGISAGKCIKAGMKPVDIRSLSLPFHDQRGGVLCHRDLATAM